jgi:SAM-dependent methyltransferase
MISKIDLQEQFNRYSKRLQEFGYSDKSVGWGGKGRLIERYKILLDYWGSPSGLSLLDLGAGFGDGAIYFLNNGGEKYTGIEYSKEFIEIGHEKHKNLGKKFELMHAEISSLNPFPCRDIICGSGLFNAKYKNSDNYKFIETTLTKALKSCSKGIAFNFLSDQVDYQEEYIFYSNLCEIIKIIERLSKNFMIKKDYFPFEYTIFITKDDSFSIKTSIFTNAKI